MPHASHICALCSDNFELMRRIVRRIMAIFAQRLEKVKLAAF